MPAPPEDLKIKAKDRKSAFALVAAFGFATSAAGAGGGS
jgi:hypothetical protein